MSRVIIKLYDVIQNGKKIEHVSVSIGREIKVQIKLC